MNIAQVQLGPNICCNAKCKQKATGVNTVFLSRVGGSKLWDRSQVGSLFLPERFILWYYRYYNVPFIYNVLLVTLVLPPFTPLLCSLLPLPSPLPPSVRKTEESQCVDNNLPSTLTPVCKEFREATEQFIPPPWGTRNTTTLGNKEQEGWTNKLTDLKPHAVTRAGLVPIPCERNRVKVTQASQNFLADFPAR